jgi:signal transduction histidine kinase
MMSEPEDGAPERRTLVLALTTRDGTLAQSVLQQGGIASTVCRDLDQLCAELDEGAAAVLLTEETLTLPGADRLLTALERQPPWSDLPLLVLTRPEADSLGAAAAFQQFGNVTLLERPIRIATLVTAVRVSLRARERQYQIRAHLAEREQAEETLRQADRRKDEFLAMLAHELRNPLSPVVNALHLLHLFPSDAVRVERLRETMERQIGNLVRLLDDLLDVARVSQGKISLHREPADFAPIVKHAVETISPFIEGRGHDFAVSLPLERVRVEADATRLEQVITNLLHNAAKYTDPGGQIRLTVERIGREVVLRVRDNGIGIEPESLPQMFDLFAQGERSLERSQGGLGIGLTLVRRLVEMHDGSIKAHSAGLGQGSEFVVRLPALPTARGPRPPARKQPGKPVVRPLRILVVEDNLDSAELMAELLGLQGHQVHAVHDGPAALAAVTDFHPQVVLCDLGLPGMDGLEVARHLRRLPHLAQTVLLAITGYGQEDAREQCHAAGFDLHLTKPVDPRELSGVLAGLPDPAEAG